MEYVKSCEFSCVGSGIGGGFHNTKELHVIKYKAAMETQDQESWEAAVEGKRKKMEKYLVWTPRIFKDVSAGAKCITSTWAMKKKANGTYRARLNARVFQQVEGVHYNASDIASPVTNNMSIRVIMVLTLMVGWIAKIVDVKGVFLHGGFDEGTEPVCMDVHEGFEKHYDNQVVLLLLKTIYGLNNAAKAFWKEILKAFGAMKCKRSNADPCMYYKWDAAGLFGGDFKNYNSNNRLYY